MISSSLSIKEFIDAIKDKEYFGLIYLADKEALEAWRQTHRSKGKLSGNQEQSKRYENSLKKFITYLRASIIPDGDDDADMVLFCPGYKRIIDELTVIRSES